MSNVQKNKVAIVGAGLAGSEAAWQLAQKHYEVDLYEMRPQHMTEAHRTAYCAELVCTNSFKSQSVENAHGLLKAEMALYDSLILRSAQQHAVPAGQALAVDRDTFSQWITQQLTEQAHIRLLREEVDDVALLLEKYARVLIATGPLTSGRLSASLQHILGEGYLAFYDAIAPVVTAESIDLSVAFKASRYDKGEAAYINCPFTQEQYEQFIAALLAADKVPQHGFENIRPFEGCLPIEVMAERGKETLRFGPMKPVGLPHPQTGEEAYAVVQLRQENALATLYNMVGFQTKMTWLAQKEVFSKIPGLQQVEFVRLGSIHRNTFINSPHLLTPRLHVKNQPHLFFAGQMTGVEGYMESTAMGIVAAQQIHGSLSGEEMPILPPTTMMGALIRYITQTEAKSFQPMNANFGLLDPPPLTVAKKARKAYLSRRALETMERLVHGQEPALVAAVAV